MRPFALEVEMIEGEEIDLEYTKAALVRGGDVAIGTGCEIERVEYSGKLAVDETARVAERVEV